MIHETEVINQLTRKLIELGYSESDLRANESTNYDRGIDLVAYESSKPKIVFEVKVSLNTSHWLESLNEEQIRYHSIIRQVQSLAKDIGAPYFAIYDGNTIFWFDVDEDGRPKRLEGPVIAYSTDESRDEGLKFAHALYKLNDIGIADFPFIHDDLLLYVGVSVLAWVLSKKGQPTLEKQLLSQKPNLSLIDDFLSESEVFMRSYSREFFSKALSILGQINLPEDKGREFVRIIDDYLEFTLANKRMAFIRLPVWMSEFLGNLGLIKDSDVVLDLYSTFDDITTAAYDINREAKLQSLAMSTLFYVWAKTKRHLLNIEPNRGRVYRGSSTFHLAFLDTLSSKNPSVVFVAPPFGLRVASDNQGKTKRSEEIYLEEAVDIVKKKGRVVAIMPENFLFSKSQQTAREKIMETAQIKAIFSLEQLMPSTSIKASILVLEKSQPKLEDTIIFARIQQSDIETSEEHARSIQKGSRVQKILEFYKKHQQNISTTTRLKDVFLIQAREVTSASWALTSYTFQKTAYQSSEYPLIRLADISSLSKGSSLTLSKRAGNLPVIGPGAVRAFSIDQSKFDFTEKKLLTNNPVVSQKGDVLINAVGPYRGHAALVEQDVENIYISRNIIIVKPSQSKVLSEYLTLALNSKFVQRQFIELTGSVILQLTADRLKDLLFPLPSLETQKQIINKAQNISRGIGLADKKIQELQLEISELTKQLQSVIEDFQSTSGESND